MVFHDECKCFVKVGFGEKHFAGALGRYRDSPHRQIDATAREQLWQPSQIFQLDEFDLDAEVAPKELSHLNIKPHKLAFSCHQRIRETISHDANAQYATLLDRINDRSGRLFYSITKLALSDESCLLFSNGRIL